MSDEKIAILDFGSQLTQLVARRVREAGVYSEVFAFNISEDALKQFAPKGIILSGSANSTLDEDAIKAPEYVWTFGVPVLGLCYGMQTMAAQLGGATKKCDKREFGHANITVQCKSSLFNEIPETNDVWMSHGDQVSVLPPGFACLASSQTCPIASMANESRKLYGIQFHPETTQTEYGQEMFKNFLYSICGCSGKSWEIGHIAEILIQEAKEQVEQHGDGGDVILGLSGGVDSSVVAAILHRAIGPRLKCVIVDHGLMRKNEVANVMKAFEEMNRKEEAESGTSPQRLYIEVVDASEKFFRALEGVADPEQKRKIIGREFVNSFDEVSSRFRNVNMLAQGTIYPDVIESAHVGNAALIKTHHNVGGLPKEMKFKLIEPLRRLFKDEVRKVGEALGLPHDFVWRHPFPGPGLGVRILGVVTREKAQKLQDADAIFMEELSMAGYYHKTSQALTALIPSKAVAVKGDGREYEEMIALRAIHTIDFMTAQVVDLPSDLIRKVARRICNEVAGVSRVLYDYTDKPPATIEYE